MEPEVKAVMEMYREAKTAVQIEGKKTAWFEVKVGVHQGSVLSPLLFAIVIDALTDHLNNDREFLYADDLAVLENSWEDITQKYARWQEALESRDLKVNIKTKAMKFWVKIVKGPVNKIDSHSMCGEKVKALMQSMHSIQSLGT